MNISFENYEEFFLLYADNELNETAKAAVDNFVADNPALKAELDLLMQTQCIPGEFSLPTDFKNNLYHPAGTTSENNTDKLLLLVDGELDAGAEKQLATYINNNPGAQKEYHLLLATKNIADTNIVFPDKQILYKKEKAPVVAINYFRLVAAACIITVVTGTFFFLNRNSDEETEGNQPMAVVPAQKKYDTSTHLPQVDVSQNTNTYPLESTTNSNTPTHSATNSNQVNSAVITQKISSAGNGSTAIAAAKPPSSTIETNGAVVNSTINNTTITQPNDVADKKNIPTAILENALTNNLQNNPGRTVTSANPEPLHLTNMAGSEDITYVADDNSNNKNTKLRGFFRKVTRAVERTTNIKTTNDEDELLIGSFAIKL